MNTRWKSLFLAIFSACLLAGSVNARVCFLADLECQKGQSQPVVVDEGEEPCTERPEYSGETLVLEGGQCPAMEYYTSWVCKDSTGYYYKEKGCRDGYIDLEDYAEDGVKNRDKYNCSYVECGRCCLLENTSCPRDYKQCVDPMEPSDNSNNDSCEDKDGNILFKLCECKDEYNIKTQECKRQGLKPGQVCGIYTNDCSCPDGYTFVTQNPDPNDCPPECNGNGCTRDKQPINVAFPGKKGMCIYDEVECKDPPYECNSANGEYAKVEDCTGSMLHAVCEKDSSNGCYKVTGCENTSLERGQTLVASRKPCYDTNNDGCNDNDDNCMEDCNCISDTCEINYVLGVQSRTCEPQFDCATLGYKYCNGDIGEVGTTAGFFYCKAIDNKRYFEGCEVNPALCMNINVNENQLGYSEDSGICEIVLPPKESDKWTVQNGLVNAEDEGYWKRQKYSKEYAEYWLNNGYYWVRPCHIVASDNILKVRLHECMSEEYDCGGSFSIVYDSTPDNEENAFPGWKTADVDDSSMANGKNCLNPVSTFTYNKPSTGPLNDGVRVECGGKDYATECKCTTYGTKTPEGCYIRVVEGFIANEAVRPTNPVNPLNSIATPTLDLPNLDDQIINPGLTGGHEKAGDIMRCDGTKCGSAGEEWLVFTGEYVEGCADEEGKRKFNKAYAYFRDPDSNKKCLSSAPIDETTDFCTGEEVCAGTVLSETEAGIRCAGECVTEITCAEGEVCETATGTYCTKCVKPKTCNSYSGFSCKEATDPITKKPYCAECENNCQKYATEKNIVWDNSRSACWIDQGSSHYALTPLLYNTFTIPGTDFRCTVQRNCEYPLPKEPDDCIQLLSEKNRFSIPNYYDENKNGEQDSGEPTINSCVSSGYFNVCQKGAKYCEQCGTTYYSDNCCKASEGNDVRWGGGDFSTFQGYLDRGFTDVTKEYYNYYTGTPNDGSSNCWYARCQEGRTKIGNGSTMSCCPKAQEGHILKNEQNLDPDLYEDVTSSEYDVQIEGCYYYKEKTATCEAYSKEIYKTNSCRTLITVGASAPEGFDDCTTVSVTKYGLEKCDGCEACDVTCKNSPVAGFIETKECAGGLEFKETATKECGGKTYYQGECVCPDKEGYYQDKAGDDGYYSEGSMGIEGCEYYKECKPDGYVTEEECKNKGKVVPTGAASLSQCNTIYYEGSCVCPDLSDQGCYFEGTSGVTYEVTGKIPEVSEDCKYVAKCDTATKNCAGGFSPLVGEDGKIPTAPVSQDTCEELGGQVKPEEMIKSTSDGICGGPLYTKCHKQTQL